MNEHTNCNVSGHNWLESVREGEEGIYFCKHCGEIALPESEAAWDRSFRYAGEHASEFALSAPQPTTSPEGDLPSYIFNVLLEANRRTLAALRKEAR